MGPTLDLIGNLSEQQLRFRYAEGKWSAAEVLGHVLDSERIFAYRALRFARNDSAPLAGFEQDDYIRGSDFHSRSAASLAQEYEHVRQATLYLFEFIGSQAWDRKGQANGVDVSVRALAWIVAGHELHHLTVLNTKYL